MNINKINIVNYHYERMKSDCEGICHRKSLPMLSVVQSLKGSYDICLNQGATYHTGPLGAFIAPAGTEQTIIHHNDSEIGHMETQWVFLDVLINGVYDLDSLFSFPILLPTAYQTAVNGILNTIGSRHGLCRDLSNLYLLIEILMKIGTEKPTLNTQKEILKRYIADHYREKITATDLAREIQVSVPKLYRFFSENFARSPSNYINDVRIENACLLLTENQLRIGEIAAAVGIEDIFYFSRLFKNKYGVSPSQYRDLNSYR